MVGGTAREGGQAMEHHKLFTTQAARKPLNVNFLGIFHAYELVLIQVYSIQVRLISRFCISELQLTFRAKKGDFGFENPHFGTQFPNLSPF